MVGAGLCCGGLEEPKALMKMGLSMVCVGHVNFLLGALVHGVVLRHITLDKQAAVTEAVVSNVLALATGLIGIVVGVLAIVLSKNKKNRGLTWSLFTVSLAAAAVAAASTIGLLVSVVLAVTQSGRSLLTSCDVSDSSCPFDPTRINSTTLILWVPLVVTCVIQVVFSSRCFAVCLSFLGLPCCPNRNRHKNYGRAINVVRPLEAVASNIEPSRSHAEPPAHSAGPSKSDHGLQRWNSAPSRQQHQPPALPQHPPREHRSLPPSERQSYRERSHRQRRETNTGSHQRAPERHHLLERVAMERSSLWI